MKTPPLLFSLPLLVSVLAVQIPPSVSAAPELSQAKTTPKTGAAALSVDVSKLVSNAVKVRSNEEVVNNIATSSAATAAEMTASTTSDLTVAPTPEEVVASWQSMRKMQRSLATSAVSSNESSTLPSDGESSTLPGTSTPPAGGKLSVVPDEPLSNLPDVNTAPCETRVLRIRGRNRQMDILTDRVHVRPQYSKGYDYALPVVGDLNATDAAASFYDLRGVDRADLIAYPHGRERKAGGKLLITRRICVRLAEGVAFSKFATTSGAIIGERPTFAEEAIILTYTTAVEAMDAVERLRVLPGVLGAHIIVAQEHIPDMVPTGVQYFSGGGPPWAPIPLTDNVDGWNPPAGFLAPVTPPQPTMAYQWWANEIATIPLPPPLTPIPTELTGMMLGGGPRYYSGGPSPVPSRVDLGDNPPVAYDPVNFPKFNGEMADIRLPLAWENLGDFDKPVSGNTRKLMIIDDGIQKSHPDLFNALDPNLQRHWDYFNNKYSAEPLDPASDSHGTSLAGIAGSRIKLAGSRIAGVAPNCWFHGAVCLKGFVDDFDWADAYAYAPPPASNSGPGGGPPEGNNRGTLKDTDRDNEWLDEDRTGFVFFEISLNASSNQGAQSALDLYPEDWLWKRAIRFSATKGAALRGVPFVTSAGNGGEGHMNVNYSEQKNSIYQIPVASVSDLGRRCPESNPGASIVCAAPSNSTNGRSDELPPYLNWPSRPPGWPANRPIVKNPPIEPDDLPPGPFVNANPPGWRRINQSIPTLQTNNAINFNFAGTSAAAAQVAGVVALMLEVNPFLQARDVKEILLRSARVCGDIRVDRGPTLSPNDDDILRDDTIQVTIGHGTGATDPQTYQLKTGQTWRMSPLGHPMHHAFGAGEVDADKAVKIAKKWKPLPVNPLPPIKRDVLADNFGANVASRNTETGGLYFPVMTTQLIPIDGRAVDIIVPGPPAGMRVEHIEVRIQLYHKRRGDLEIKFIAPGEAGWEKGRELESDLYVPHREDSSEDRWSTTVPELRDPLDWTFTTVRHWGTIVEANTGGIWKVRVRDAVTQGKSPGTMIEDPVPVSIANPTDTQSQRIAGVGITYHGTYGKAISNSPPVVSTKNIRFEPTTTIRTAQLEVEELGRDPNTQEVIFPVKSWDFWKGVINRVDGAPAITYTPVQPTAPAVDFFEFFPPQARDAIDPTVHLPISALGVPWPLQPMSPMWVTFQLDPAARPATWPAPPVDGSMGALTQRPRWAELTLDELWLVIRDTQNANPNTNFIHARLNRSTGQLEVIPHNRGKYLIQVYAENMLGMSKPKEIEITVTPPGYDAWADVFWDAPDLSDPAWNGQVSGWLADPDGDGVVNGLEYALRLNPTIPDPGPIPAYRIEGDEVVFSWTRDLSAIDAIFHAQVSEDLENWADVDPTQVGGSNNLADYEYRLPLVGDSRLYFRLWSDYSKVPGAP